MKNRIKEFRLMKDLTQKECVKEFNASLKKDKKGITTATFSRWENGINSPTDKMWQALADFFETKPIVLQGALGLDEIIKIIRNSYVKYLHDLFQGKERPNNLGQTVSIYLAGIKAITYESPVLKVEHIKSFDFWKLNFAFIFLVGQPMMWLITTKPVNLDINDAESVISNTLFNYINDQQNLYINNENRFDTSSGLRLMLLLHNEEERKEQPNFISYLAKDYIPEIDKLYLNIKKELNKKESLGGSGFNSDTHEIQFYSLLHPDESKEQIRQRIEINREQRRKEFNLEDDSPPSSKPTE